MKKITLVLLSFVFHLICISQSIQTDITQEKLEQFKREYQYLQDVQTTDFLLKDKNKRTVRLNDFRDKVIIIDFWSTGCGASISDFPYLSKLQSFYKDTSKIIFIGICIDLKKKKSEWKKLLVKHQMDGIQLFLPMKNNSTLENRFYLDSIKSFPTYLLVSKSGMILGKLPNTESNLMPYIIDNGLNGKYTANSFEEAITFSDTFKKWFFANYSKTVELKKIITKSEK